jgi:hypothetical protein
MWWWKVALHLDEAQIALANAMAHNLADQRPIFALQDKLREGQAILLEIFRAKGLLPGQTNGQVTGQAASQIPASFSAPFAAPPVPVMSEPAVPEQMIADADLPGPAGSAQQPFAQVPDAASDGPARETTTEAATEAAIEAATEAAPETAADPATNGTVDASPLPAEAAADATADRREADA